MTLGEPCDSVVLRGGGLSVCGSPSLPEEVTRNGGSSSGALGEPGEGVLSVALPQRVGGGSLGEVVKLVKALTRIGWAP